MCKKTSVAGKLFKVIKETYSYDLLDKEVKYIIDPPTIRIIPAGTHLFALGCAVDFYNEEMKKEYKDYFSEPFCFLYLFDKHKVILNEECVSEEGFHKHLMEIS